MLLNFSVHALVKSVTVPYQLVLSFLSHPEVSAVHFLQDSHLHIPLGVAWQVEVIPSGLCIPVHIPQMLFESFPEAPVSCANVLLPTGGHSTGDGIAQVPGVTVHLVGQFHCVVGCCRSEGLSWLDIGAGWAAGLAALLHSRQSSPWSAYIGKRTLGKYLLYK